MIKKYNKLSLKKIDISKLKTVKGGYCEGINFDKENNYYHVKTSPIEWGT